MKSLTRTTEVVKLVAKYLFTKICILVKRHFCILVSFILEYYIPCASCMFYNGNVYRKIKLEYKYFIICTLIKYFLVIHLFMIKNLTNM